MKTKIVVVLLGAVMAASCTTKGATVYLPATTVEVTTTSTEVATYDKYDAYIQGIQSEYPNLVKATGPEFWIEFGTKLCSAILAGATIEQLMQQSLDDGLDLDVLAWIIGAAIPSLCPENSWFIKG